MSDIFERLMQLENDRPSERTAPLPEAIIERMREAASRFNGPCRFVAGDVVTARRGTIIQARYVGIPSLVISTNDTLGFQWTGENGSADNGARVNMRVLSYDANTDSIVARWEDSANYELFSEYQARQSGGDNGAAI